MLRLLLQSSHRNTMIKITHLVRAISLHFPYNFAPLSRLDSITNEFNWLVLFYNYLYLFWDRRWVDKTPPKNTYLMMGLL